MNATNISKQVNEAIANSNSVKAKVAGFMASGKGGTIEQLAKKFEATEVTVRTALYDLRSKKYGIGVPLNIERDEKGVYKLNGEKAPKKAATKKQASKKQATKKAATKKATKKVAANSSKSE